MTYFWPDFSVNMRKMTTDDVRRKKTDTQLQLEVSARSPATQQLMRSPNTQQ